MDGGGRVITQVGRSGGKGAGGGGRARAAAYQPAKLKGAAAVQLDPRKAAFLTGALLLIGMVATLTTGGRGAALAQSAVQGVQRQLGAAGFRLEKVNLEGVSDAAARDVLLAAALERDTPILGIDLEALRQRVQAVGWVEDARVVRLLPNTLVISAHERPRLAVWQVGGRASVIDGDGKPIPEADPGRFADLPLVVGDGAATAAAAILPQIASRPRLAQRVEALVRVDGRRWDLRLKDGGLIQLPASGEDAALIGLDALDARARLLELGFARVDLRQPGAVTVRPRAPGDEAVLTAAAAPPVKG